MALRDYRVTPPFINARTFPETEQKHVRAVMQSIAGLSSYIVDFEAALDLFDLSEFLSRRNFLNRQFGKWQFLAARDGAMSLYHFHRVLVHGGEGFKGCPTLRQQVNHRALKSARKRFSNLFPEALKARHSVAHSAEMNETHEVRIKNGVSGTFEFPGFINATNVGNVNVKGSLVNRKFINTHDGMIVSYEISETSLQHLAVIASEYYSGFDKVNPDANDVGGIKPRFNFTSSEK